MSEQDARQNPVAAWVKGHLLASALIALVLFLAVVFLVASLAGGDSVDAPISGATSTTQVAGSTTVVDPDRPEVPQVDCRVLLTDDEVDEVLFGEDVTGPRGHFVFGQGETCRMEPDDDTDDYIEIGPGDSQDFEADAQVSGAPAESIDGVGDGARWFDDGESGVLSVGVNLADSSLIYRVEVSRSGSDADQRLDQATRLALAALPRFSGTDPGRPPPAVDLCQLVSDERAEDILAPYRESHPATRDDILATENFSEPVDLSVEGDAACTKLILAEIYIETQQGSESDFETGASIEGVIGESVTGVGDGAVFFADVPHQGSFQAPHVRGVLAVRAGDAVFRVIIAVPDTPADDHLEILRGLANGAMTHIPGAPEPGLEVVTFDEETPDVAPESLFDLVYDGVESGEWTEAEGLISVLQWMAGSDQSTFGDFDLPDLGGTMVVRSAETYVANGAEDAGDVQFALDALVLDLDDLSGVPGTAHEPEATLTVSAVPVAQETGGCDVEESCVAVIDLAEYPDLDPERFDVRVFYPGPWETDSVAIDAFNDAVKKFDELGGMAPADFILGGLNGTSATLNDEGSRCFIHIGAGYASLPSNDLLQLVAEEVARCFIAFDLFPQLFQNPHPWLEEGLAKYLGGVVYSKTNTEHKALPGLLAQQELYNSMLQRTATNWVFFEYLDTQSNAAAVMNLMRGLPESGDLANALAGVAVVDDVYNDLGQALSDSAMPDIGGGNVPYAPQSWQVILSSPKAFDATLDRFSTKRYRLEVPNGQYACGVTATSDGAHVAWRPGAPGASGGWSTDVPDTLEGNSVLLVTSVDDGASVSFEATKTGDNPDCEEEPFDPEQGDVVGPILDLCEAICDPSAYYWGPLRFDG